MITVREKEKLNIGDLFWSLVISHLSLGKLGH